MRVGERDGEGDAREAGGDTMKPLAAGFVGIVIGVGAMLALAIVRAPRDDQPSNLVFPDKTFYLGADRSLLRFSGSITGTDLAYPNNVFAVSCDKSKGICQTASVSQIGANQIGSVDLLDYDITEWSPDYVVARSDDPATTVLCSIVTFHANLHTEDVLYVVEPVLRNIADQQLCPPKFNDGATHRYRIDQSPFRRELDKRLSEKKP